MDTTAQATDQIVGYDVVDPQGNKVGSVESVWLNGSTNDLQFIGVKTARLMGKTHAVPVDSMQTDAEGQTLQLPYTQDQIKNSPGFDANSVLTQAQQTQINDYFDGLQTQGGSDTMTETVAVPGGSTGPGQFPVDNVTYDLYTLISEKLKGLEAYDQYLQDAEGDDGLSNLLQQLRDMDARGVQQLHQYLVDRFGGGSGGARPASA